MTVGEEADDHQEEDDEEPEDDLHPPVPQSRGAAQGPGLTATGGADWRPAVTNPLPLDLRTGRHSVPDSNRAPRVAWSGLVWCQDNNSFA